ncbi:MAG: hypothetical protein WD845_18150 [Pirellulales bacterium]
MDRYPKTTDVACDSPPSKAWLFAQAILGKPIPRIVSPVAKASARREELTRLAQFSFPRAKELRNLQAAEREAHRNRELLVWAAQISTKAQQKLREIQQRESQERRAWHAIEQFAESDSLVTEWNEADHPRAPEGTTIGGQWVPKGGGGAGRVVSTGRPASTKERHASDDDEQNPHMLELAHTWWQTKGALEQARRDIQELPRRIASERAQLGSGGRYAYIHSQNLAKAQQDLETAKALAPELEKQLSDLERQYRDSGYDEIPYSTFTPAETIVGGKGIEEVGRAVARGGMPAGLQSTGIEFEIASAGLAGPAILRLGKAVLGKAALRKAATKAATRSRASLGRSTSKNYRKTFVDAHPDRQGKVVVHHGVEQQVLDRYPGVITESELHSLENLRGIPKGANSETHLSEIRREWNRFYDQHPTATKEQLLDKATEIDEKYGHLFDPPIR